MHFSSINIIWTNKKELNQFISFLKIELLDWSLRGVLPTETCLTLVLEGTYGHRGTCQSFQESTFSQVKSTFHQIKISLVLSTVVLIMQTHFLHCLFGRAGVLLTHIESVVPFKLPCIRWSRARSLPFCTWAGFYATCFLVVSRLWVLSYHFSLWGTFGDSDFIIQLLGSPVYLYNTWEHNKHISFVHIVYSHVKWGKAEFKVLRRVTSFKLTTMILISTLCFGIAQPMMNQLLLFFLYHIYRYNVKDLNVRRNLRSTE